MMIDWLMIDQVAWQPLPPPPQPPFPPIDPCNVFNWYLYLIAILIHIKTKNYLVIFKTV